MRTRRYVKKFMLMRANIQAVSLKIQTLKSQNAMAQAMKGVTKAMQNMNKQMKLPEIQKIMMEFEKQSEIMDMKEEMMSDTIGESHIVDAYSLNYVHWVTLGINILFQMTLLATRMTRRRATRSSTRFWTSSACS